MLRHLIAWLRRGRLDDEIREELAQHVAWTAERLEVDGLSHDEARRRAAVAVGNLARLREESRAIWGFPPSTASCRTSATGWRQLRRTPLFTLATMTTLALTIGGTCALFAIANAVVLRPLAFPRSDRVVSISIAQQGTDLAVMDESTARLAMASPSRPSSRSQHTTPRAPTSSAAPGRNAWQGCACRRATSTSCGCRRRVGRAFAPDEMVTGGPPVVILSDALASRAFGRSQDALDRQVTLDDRRYTVIGVMPPGPSFPARRDFWLPLMPRTIAGGGFFYTQFIGRLRDGTSALTARDDLAALRRTRGSELPAQARESDVRVMPLHERLYGEFLAPVTLLLGVVVSVLLIGCANVANLLLARASVRRRN